MKYVPNYVLKKELEIFNDHKNITISVRIQQSNSDLKTGNIVTNHLMTEKKLEMENFQNSNKP